ncbi:MAG: OB-fold nucleic acid binding domain-containing protein, partial [Pseudomonadota bacterium]
KYQHPDLEPILQATYGVPVYQEQVMRMAQEIAGYSLGEADLLRRAMGKKKKEEMDKQRLRFVEGAAKLKGMSSDLANDVFDTMAKFAGYGFNKSHAAAYAQIGYHTAYLKCHHPVAFMAASMSLDIHNTDKLAAFFQEAKRLKIPVVAPDVTRSTADFDVDGDAVVYGLGALKGVGLEAMRHLERVRGTADFSSLQAFAEAVDPKELNKKAFGQLSRAGAFDTIEQNRARALAAAPTLAALCSSAAEDRAGGQGGLFGESEPAARVTLPKIKDWSVQQRLDEEFRAIGFYFSGHPLDDVLQGLNRERVTLAMEIEDRAEDGKPLDLIGIVRARVEKPARNGGKFAFLTLSDPTGEVELMVYPEVLTSHRDLLDVGQAVAITVSVRRRDEEIRLAAEAIRPLAKARVAKPSDGLTIRLGIGADPADIAAVTEALKTLPGPDKGEVHVELPLRDGRVVTIRLPDRYTTGVPAKQLLKTAPGVARVDAA